MQSQEREEKFLKGNLGGQIRLRIWKKHQKTNLVFMHLARYTCTHQEVLKYQYAQSENLANK